MLTVYKEGKAHIKNLSSHLKSLEKEQNKSKGKRRKEIIKTGAGISKIENQKTTFREKSMKKRAVFLKETIKLTNLEQ